MMKRALCGRRSAGWVCAFSLGAALALGSVAPVLAMGAEGKAPVIVSTGSSVGGEVSANASIDPEGLATSYEITLACGACGPLGAKLAAGQLPAVQEAIGVSLNVTGIAPGNYSFHVAARNAAGEASAYGELTVPPPPGTCLTGCGSNEQYGSEVPGWYNKLSESESAATREKYESEQRAKQLKEQEEQKAKEARYAEEAAAAAALKRREEEEEAQRGPGGGAMLASTNIAVQHGAFSLVELECYGATTCSGRLTITARVGSIAKRGRRHSRRAVIGTANFSIPGDTARTVRIEMKSLGRKLLNVAGGHLSASLTIDERLPNAGWTQTEKTVRLFEHTSRRKTKR